MAASANTAGPRSRPPCVAPPHSTGTAITSNISGATSLCPLMPFLGTSACTFSRPRMGDRSSHAIPRRDRRKSLVGGTGVSLDQGGLVSAFHPNLSSRFDPRLRLRYVECNGFGSFHFPHALCATTAASGVATRFDTVAVHSIRRDATLVRYGVGMDDPNRSRRDWIAGLITAPWPEKVRAVVAAVIPPLFLISLPFQALMAACTTGNCL